MSSRVKYTGLAACCATGVFLFVAVQATAEDPRIPVHDVVKAGDLEALRTILKTDAAAVTATNGAGETPLHVAMAIPNPAMVETLLAAKATVDARNARGCTPLQEVMLVAYLTTNATLRQVEVPTAPVTAASEVAARDEDVVKVVRMLLAAGADPNAKFAGGATVIHYACASLKTNLLQTLLVPRANLNARNVTGVHRWKCLLDHKANVESLNNNMETALNVAVRKGAVDVVTMLLDHGAWMGNRPIAPDETVLHTAVRNGNLALIQLLLDRKAPVNVTDGAGFTPLLNAAEDGRCDVVTLLADHGANLNGTEAVRWYRLSAAQNHAESQFSLGSSYCDGYGVERDHVEAYAWYNLASRTMRSAERERDRLARKMTWQQIQDGHKRVGARADCGDDAHGDCGEARAILLA